MISEGRLAKEDPFVLVSMTARRAYIKQMFRTESHIYVMIKNVTSYHFFSLTTHQSVQTFTHSQTYITSIASCDAKNQKITSFTRGKFRPSNWRPSTIIFLVSTFCFGS